MSSPPQTVNKHAADPPFAGTTSTVRTSNVPAAPPLVVTIIVCTADHHSTRVYNDHT